MKKRILIAGGTGLLGSRLIELLDKDKYSISILSRNKKTSSVIRYFQWNLDKALIDEDAVEAEIIINLTGAGIADKRWTKERKKILIDSRVESARLLHSALLKTKHRPELYISASAIGIYGNRAEEKLYESSEPGLGFMAECCRAWEDSAAENFDLCDRWIINRVGIVLSTLGGALPKILMTDFLGIFNYFGQGNQYYSWIHIDDLCRIFIHQIENKSSHGIYNAVSPSPVTNRSFTNKIKDVLKGSLVFPVPVFGLRLLLGEMADVVLNSNRVYPSRLNQDEFRFEFETLEKAVRDLVDRKV